MKLYAGNLSSETTQDDLRRAFETHGQVSSVSLLRDQVHDGRPVGLSRGFGFIVMPDRLEAQAALRALHLHEVGGRAMTVAPARPRRTYRLRR